MKNFLLANCLTKVLVNLSNVQCLWISLTRIWLKTRFEGCGVVFPGSVTLSHFESYGRTWVVVM